MQNNREQRRTNALPMYVYISLSRIKTFPLAKSLSTSLLCMLTDGIMCSIMPALSLFVSVCVCVCFFQESLKIKSPHTIAWLNYSLIFKVFSSSYPQHLSSLNKQHVCVLTPINNFVFVIIFHSIGRDLADTLMDLFSVPTAFL